MKKLFLLGVLVLGFTMHAQQSPVLNQSNTFTMPVLPAGISLPAQKGSNPVTINASLQYYAVNYRKVFYTDRFFDDDNKDKFADFYDAYNYGSRNNSFNITPMIKNMPAPGPNLDYFNVDKSSGGLFDKVVTTKK